MLVIIIMNAMKKLLLLLLLSPLFLTAQIGMTLQHKNPFFSTWDTTILSTGSTGADTVQLPLLSSGGFYNFNVDWGDGNSSNVTNATLINATHQYSIAGVYTITVVGLLNGWAFANRGDRLKILDISQWGDLKGAGASAFLGCSNLDVSAIDALDVSGITDFSSQFHGCSSLTRLDVSTWDVSQGTNFFFQFRLCTSLTSLDVSNWDVSQGTDFTGQFIVCSLFTTIDVSAWDVSQGTHFGGQFWGCSSLTNLDVSAWNVSQAVNLFDFMTGTNMQTVYYDQTLINWEALNLQPGLGINFGSSTYSLGGAAETARNNIIANDGWTITDGGGL